MSENVNEVQQLILKQFPHVEKVFYEKLQEGYKLLEFKYAYHQVAGREDLDIIFSKNYVKYSLEQGKGPYAGGFSHCTFGPVGERGEIIY